MGYDQQDYLDACSPESTAERLASLALYGDEVIRYAVGENPTYLRWWAGEVRLGADLPLSFIKRVHESWQENA